ncbi:adenosylcobinamide-GDP ribazoletransferase [Alicyclobacillus fastidiosus]|uniref:Adenosylcobinamide-GDP ribazoletransferase n=1 Tax=Alicyclobacillus fastidiosus TaxID=392011 RepID=A0ABV5ACA7_9BACL|nr:adenosylcobinamide-GDP ribazoletransferase [Alicyclobacillus fastidiosus]WEH11425.1 adenosylcobinamide-GDP ribazoletransferase [Alicyclobacillus fastidiosus]
MRQLYRSLVCAWQFFTIIPAPRITAPTDKDIVRSAYFLPVVGVFLGAVLAVVRWLLAMVMPLSAATFLALALYTLTTGALHVDGLMDTADAVGSRKPREEALTIMKDSRVGAMGAIAAVLLLGGKWIAMSALPTSALMVFLLVPALSRLAMLWAMRLAPAARPGGLGAMFAKRVRLTPIVALTAGVFACALATMPWVPVLGSFVAFALVLCLATNAFCRRFGGMTGDTYGALAELMEWVLYFVAIALNH